MQKRYAILFIKLVFGYLLYGQQNSVQICFDEDCSIAINGESNVSHFTCTLVELPVAENPIPLKSVYRNGRLEMNNVKIKIASSGFKCSNPAMNIDFQKALKTSEYPYLSLYFSYLVLEHQPKPNEIFQNVEAQINLKIAGIERKYFVVLRQVEFEKDAMKINGLVKLKMSHFNIKPPQALFGMIKSKDEIAIQFTLQFCLK